MEMRNFKRYLSFVVLFAMVLGMRNVLAAADSSAVEYSVTVEIDGVVITGKSEEKLPILVIIIFAEDEDVSLDANPYTIQKIAQAEADENGEFRIEATLLETERNYVAKIKSARNDEIEKIHFYLPSESDRQTAYEDFRKVTSPMDVAAFLEKYNVMLKLDIAALAALKNPNAVLEAFFHAKSDVRSASDIIHTYASLLEAQQNREWEETLDQAALLKLNQVDISELEKVLNENNIRFKLNLVDQWGYARILSERKNSNDSFEALYQRIVHSTSISQLQTAFAEAVAVEIINIVSWLEMDSAINAHSHIFSAALNGAFGKLHSIDKAAIYKKAETERFSTVADIVNYFNLQASLEKPASPPGSSGSGVSGIYKAPEGMLDSGNTPYPTEIAQPPFIDLDSTPWAKESIAFLAHEGIISGIGDGKFTPNDAVKREEFLKMLLIAFDLVVEGAVMTFEDVSRDSWTYPYVASAQKLNITTGINMTCFGVGLEITRQDMAVLTYRTLRQKGLQFKNIQDAEMFADSEQIAEYAADAIFYLQTAGIINGYGDGRFAPNEFTTRAQAAKIIYEILNR